MEWINKNHVTRITVNRYHTESDINIYLTDGSTLTKRKHNNQAGSYATDLATKCELIPIY